MQAFGGRSVWIGKRRCFRSVARSFTPPDRLHPQGRCTRPPLGPSMACAKAAPTPCFDLWPAHSTAIVHARRAVGDQRGLASAFSLKLDSLARVVASLPWGLIHRSEIQRTNTTIQRCKLEYRPRFRRCGEPFPLGNNATPSGSVNHRKLRDDDWHRVIGHRGISRNQGAIICHRLSDQHAIERIAMMCGQCFHAPCV